MTWELLVYVAVIGAVISLTAVGSENEKWIKFAVGAVLTSAITLAVFNTARDFVLPEADGDASYSEGEEIAEAVLSEALARGVEVDICDVFSLSEEDVSVFTQGFTYGSERAEAVRVVLTGRAVLTDTVSLRKYVTERYGECEVITDFE